ncbi:MAG: HEAT repeat domain-containing protein [Planctomycetota bacterium]
MKDEFSSKDIVKLFLIFSHALTGKLQHLDTQALNDIGEEEFLRRIHYLREYREGFAEDLVLISALLYNRIQIVECSSKAKGNFVPYLPPYLPDCKKWVTLVLNELKQYFFSACNKCILGHRLYVFSEEIDIPIMTLACRWMLEIWNDSYLRPDILQFFRYWTESTIAVPPIVRILADRTDYQFSLEDVPIFLGTILDLEEHPFELIAFECLGRLGPIHPEIVPTLFRIVKNAYVPLDLRQRAIFTMGEMKSQDESIFNLLKNSLAIPELRYASAVALAKLRQNLSEVIPILVRHLLSPEALFASHAEQALIEIGPQGVFETLSSLNDTDAYHRAEKILSRTMIDLIKKVPQEKESGPKLSLMKKGVKELIEISNKKFEAYQSATRLLTKILETIQIILKETSSPNEALRELAQNTLQQLQQDEVRRESIAKALGGDNAFEHNPKISLLNEILKPTHEKFW